MNETESIFMRITEKHTQADPDIYLGKMMSAPGLKYKDQVFAFYTKDDAMGFRLGADFNPTDAGIIKYKPLSPFKKKPPLKGWYIIEKEECHTWEHLAELSLTFTKTLK